MQFNSLNRMIGASLLTAGTCIGAGMLGFPIYTAPGGFIPALCWFATIYLVMSYSAYLTINVLFTVSKHYKQIQSIKNTESKNIELNFLSLSEYALGKLGRHVIWGLILIFLYCVISAYVTGGISILRLLAPDLFHQIMPVWGWLGLFLSPFILSLWYGYQVSDYLNRFFLVGLLMTYGLLFIYLIQHATGHLSEPRDWEASFSALPILVTAFGYHLSIPSFKNYLDPNHQNQKKTQIQLVRAVLLGGVIALSVYLVWEWLIFQIIPHADLLELSALSNNTSSDSLKTMNALLMIRAPQVKNLILGFSFFALVSSCLGVAIGLYDFFADGLQLQKQNRIHKVYLLVLTFLPPSLFALIYPGGFLYILKYAGVFAAILLVIFPAIMSGCIRLKTQNQSLTVKNSWDLVLTIGFGLLVIMQIII